MEHLVHAPGARKWTETDHSWHLHLNTWGAGWEVLCWNNRVLSRSEATDVARHSALGARSRILLEINWISSNQIWVVRHIVSVAKIFSGARANCWSHIAQWPPKRSCQIGN